MSDAENQPATPESFDNGLTDEESDKLDDAIIDIIRVKMSIEELDRHRSYSLAITKLDEAQHWLRDRKGRAP